MPDAKQIAIGVGATAAVGAGAYAVYYVATSGNLGNIARRPIQVSGRPLTDEDITRWVTRDGNEVRFADNKTGMPPHREWTHAPYQMVPRVPAHEVPVIAPFRTPLVVGGFNRLSGERVRYLNAVREVLRAGGLSHYDPRILMILWANESGWDRHCWGNNLGNVKAQGTVYAQSFPQLVRDRKVRVTVPESIGVQVFMDNLRSIDGYHVMPDPATYARYCDRVAIRSPNYANRTVTVGGRAYRGAEDALRAGGIDGAEAFARIISLGGYSPEGPDARTRMFRGSWAVSQRLCGAGWVR